jgi:molecular chaperone DnaJ
VSVKDFIEKDYYAALGVPKNASADEIKKAYRKLAREFHPDVNKGDAEAEERFKEISEAYDVLADDKRRREYDEVRSASAAGFRMPPGGGANGNTTFDFSNLFGAGAPGGGFGTEGTDLGDLFGGLFGGTGRRRGPRRGDDLETSTTIGFAEAVEGTTISLTMSVEGPCTACAGTGARPGTKISTCGTCQGSGQFARNAGGFSIPERCPTCGGRGRLVEQPCTACAGRGRALQNRTITARLPAGVRDGQRIRLKGKGGPGEPGAPSGDLFVTVNVRSHRLFGRKGRNLTLTVPIRFDEAALGADVTVPTLHGDPVTLRIPAGTTSGRTFRVRGRGVPAKGGDDGDLLVTVEVAVPQRLDAAAREAIEAYREATGGENPREGLFDGRADQ